MSSPQVPSARLTKAQVLELAEQQKVKFLRLQFTDILGTIKNVEIPNRQFEAALDGKVMFDGSSIEGFVRIEESDMYLRPDLSTFCVFPWSGPGGETIARLICDIVNPDGTNLQKITEGPGSFVQATWSPDGKKIVSNQHWETDEFSNLVIFEVTGIL